MSEESKDFRAMEDEQFLSRFYLDGHQSTREEVRTLAEEMQIQTDNLCQFLPQV